MTDSAELTRFRGTRKTYLRNISNQERHILDLIQKPIDEKTETSLTASKNSLLEKFEKVKILNENILEHLTGGEFEKELEENLDKTDQIHEILGLRKILDQVECSVRNLRTLKVETSCYGSLLVPLVNEKLPNELRVNIAKSFANDIWDIDIMINFLKKEVEAKPKVQHCVFCDKNNHSSNRCFKITDMEARKDLVKQKKLCFVCLEKGHAAYSCTLKNYSCKKCHGKHNIAICTFSKQNTQKHFPSTEERSETPSATSNISTNKNNVLLPTATVSVSNTDNTRTANNIQLLFDSGSQRSYISTEIRNRSEIV